MVRRAIATGRLLAASLLLSVPFGAVLVVLTATMGLSPLAAVTGYGASVGLLALMLRPYLQDVAEVAHWTRALAAGIDAPAPVIHRAQPVEEIASSIGQLRRSWQGRQAELAANARWNESLFDNLPDPLVLLDKDRKVVRVNQAAIRAFGRDMTGRDLAAVLRDPQVLEATDAVLAGEAGRETEFTSPVPVERSFRVRVERLKSNGEDESVAILALHDLTTVRRMEQMRADFVANASHELRTPLATLLGFIETLRGPARDDTEARDRFLAIMFDQASRMSRLVNDLLSLSRIELNEHFQPLDPVDLGAIVKSGIEAMQPLAAAKSMVLETEIHPAAARVAGQTDELAQLVQNLLDNAVKYGHEATPVTITLKPAASLPASAGPALRGGGAVVLSVRDHGDGIAKEHLPRLTERFYRVDTARSRKLGGTGLGLAIVKHIVNRHRGALSIESHPGQGSTFSVYLPAAEGAKTTSATG